MNETSGRKLVERLHLGDGCSVELCLTDDDGWAAGFFRGGWLFREREDICRAEAPTLIDAERVALDALEGQFRADAELLVAYADKLAKAKENGTEWKGKWKAVQS